MALHKVILELLCIMLLDSFVIGQEYERDKNLHSDLFSNEIDIEDDNKLSRVYSGVYTECFFHLSYSCLQKKTLLYLRELNKLSEVSVFGDYVKFVKVNITENNNNQSIEEYVDENNSGELSILIDKAVDIFFDNHVVKFSALGRNISIPNTVEEFVGRKKRKGGGGGGGGGHDFDGKKKIMMMAMMCMKMKFMMMVPAMMGMMGMMSFKGMMFSMLSFILSKMMLLMKLLEKKGGGFGGGAAGGGDNGWAGGGGGGGGGAWMPAGGQDYNGGGYDANGQWQSRSIIDFNRELENKQLEKKPIISYVVPTIRYSNNNPNESVRKMSKHLDDELVKGKRKPKLRKKRSVVPLFDKFDQIDNEKPKSRKKRGILDTIQNAYSYWINQFLGSSNRRKSNFPRYKIVNGIKYVYHPRIPQKFKMPQSQIVNNVKNNDESFRPIIIAEDFNKGETVEGHIESRMNRKKFHKMKNNMNDAVDENPWE